MIKMLEYLTVYLTGALGYGALELLWRGRTHWSMLLTGGFCFTLLYIMHTRLSSPLPLRCLLGAMLVTCVEFTVGAIVNVTLGWNVWDYSGMRCNIGGQVCLLYSSLWLLMGVPVSWLSRALYARFG